MDEAGCAEILALVDRELLEGVFSAAASGGTGAPRSRRSGKLFDAGEPIPAAWARSSCRCFGRSSSMLAAGAPGGRARGRPETFDRPVPRDAVRESASRRFPGDRVGRSRAERRRRGNRPPDARSEARRASPLEVVIEDVLFRAPPRPAAPAAPTAPPRSDARGPRILSLVSVEAERAAAGSPAPRLSRPMRLSPFLRSAGRPPEGHGSPGEPGRVHWRGRRRPRPSFWNRQGRRQGGPGGAAGSRKLLAEVAREASGAPCASC